jgi:hypothetical protein
MFREHHIPAGIMHRKQHEFLNLQQGFDSVYEYIKKFNYLAQYDTHHVDTDEKKAELLRKGLSLPLRNHLVLFRDLSFKALVSAAIDQDGTYRAFLDKQEKKMKRAMSGPGPPKYHLIYTPSAGKSRVLPPPPKWYRHPPR